MHLKEANLENENCVLRLPDCIVHRLPNTQSHSQTRNIHSWHFKAGCLSGVWLLNPLAAKMHPGVWSPDLTTTHWVNIVGKMFQRFVFKCKYLAKIVCIISHIHPDWMMFLTPLLSNYKNHSLQHLTSLSNLVYGRQNTITFLNQSVDF